MQIPRVLAQEGDCRIRVEGRAQIITLSLSSTFQRERLTLDFITNSRRKTDTTISQTFKLAGRPLLQIEAIRQANSTRISMSYGAAFRGVRRVSLRSTDETLRGNIDGRTISPFRIGTDPNSITFADGRPPPTVRADTDLINAMAALQQQAAGSRCVRLRSSDPPSGEEAHVSTNSDPIIKVASLGW